jgi:hypothetical protein
VTDPFLSPLDWDDRGLRRDISDRSSAWYESQGFEATGGFYSTAAFEHFAEHVTGRKFDRGEIGRGYSTSTGLAHGIRQLPPGSFGVVVGSYAEPGDRQALYRDGHAWMFATDTDGSVIFLDKQSKTRVAGPDYFAVKDANGHEVAVRNTFHFLHIGTLPIVDGRPQLPPRQNVPPRLYPTKDPDITNLPATRPAGDAELGADTAAVIGLGTAAPGRNLPDDLRAELPELRARATGWLDDTRAALDDPEAAQAGLDGYREALADEQTAVDLVLEGLPPSASASR